MLDFPDLATARKIGIIVPSSNTAVETLTTAIFKTLNANVTLLFTRIRVLTLSTDSSSISQFGTDTFVQAAQLLADAEADAILWNGTSGMFVGGTLDDDRKLAKAMTDATGVPCTTNTIATVAALRYLGIRDVSIAVPYTPELTTKLDDFFTGEGYKVHKALCTTETPASNIEIAKSTPDVIMDVIRRSVTPETKAVLVACTNWPAAPLAERLESELGIPVLDSIAVTAWEALRMIGFTNANKDMHRWGSLLASL